MRRPLYWALFFATLAALFLGVFFYQHPVGKKAVQLKRNGPVKLGPVNDVYLTQLGGGDGSSCGSALAVSYFNNAANWTSGTPTGRQIGPGTTVHLCGAFLGAANSNLLTTQGSGISGTPITIQLESGATLKAPYWSGTTGAINISNNFIVLTGTTTCGVINGATVECTEFIQDTLNGVSGQACPGGPCTNQQNSIGIFLNGCTGCEIKNLGIFDLYDRVANTADLNQFGLTVDINGGSSLHVHNLHATNSANGPAYVGTGTTISGVEIDHNWIQGTHVAVQVGDGQANSVMNGFAIHDNDISGAGIWDATNGTTHLHNEGIHLFVTFGTSGSALNSPTEYNNYFHGANGQFFTAFTFLEFVTSPYVFNNLFVIEQGTVPTNGTHGFKACIGGKSFNNTMVMGTGGTGIIVQNASSNINVKNNLTSGTNSVYMNSDSSETGQVWDFNLYYQQISSNFFFAAFFSFSGWQGLGFDAHSLGGANPNLSPTYTLQNGSAAIGAATNLTSICTGQPNPGLGALCFDRLGNPRPSVGNWDIGAYNSSTLSMSPSPVAFGSQIDGTTSSVTTVTVSNAGPGSATLSTPYFSITGANAGDFANVGGGTCANGGTIAPSGSCTVRVTFTPTAPGSRSAVLTIVGNALAADSLTGTGIAVSPTVSLSRSSIAFGSVTTGTSSGSQAVTLTNTGTASLSVTSISLTGANANQFSTNSNTCGASLAVNASCSVNVVFSPTAVASDTANLTFVTNASTSPDNVALTGSGVAPVQPSLSISPSPAAFGNQASGTTSSGLTVTITNSGPGTQTFATPFFVISGTNASDFARTGGTCSNGGTLGAGSCTIILTFTPGATGARTGLLTINGTASITDSLTGTGTAPAVSLSPTSIAFGNQTQGTSSGNRAVTLTNTGTGPLAITSITLTGANAADFSTNSSTCGSSLAASASCSLNVVFSPSLIAAETASLTYTTNASTSPDNVSLTGTGIAVTIPVLSFSPSPGAFGSQQQGTTSSPLTITVSNIGTATQNLSTPYWTLSGANASSFANAGTGTCVNGGTIAVSGSCTVKLTFTPSTTGALAGTLTINGTTIASDSLTGTGVSPVLSVSPSPAAFGNQAVSTTSSPLTVTLSNTGTASEVLSTPYFTITGTNAGDFANAGTGTCANGGTVATSSSCTINLTFTPSGTGGRAATLNISGTLSTSDSLSGTGTAPAVSLNPVSIAFGNQTTGTTSGNHAVTLTNTGNASLTISNITLTGTNAAEFGTNGSTCGGTLAASAACSINVTFSPLTAAAKSANLTFTTSAASSPNNVPLTGTGVVPAVPVVSLSPSPGVFGNQNMGSTSASLTITVTNTGTANEILSTPYFTLTGVNVTSFANAGTGTCTNGGTISASGGNCTIKLTFTPTAIGALTATLNVNGTASASDVLTGTGISGVVSLSPTSLNFGNQNNGTSSNNSLITLTNTGTGVLTITSITVTGTNATEFSTNSSTCGATLAASASCTLNAVFSPVTAGAKSASVTFTTNGATSPDAVTMIGTGLTPSPNPTPAPAITIVSILPPGSVVLTSGSFVVSPRYSQITPQGCTIDGVTFQNPCRFTLSCGNCTKNTTVRWNGTVVSQNYKNGVVTASVPISLIPIPTASTDYSLSLSN